MPRSARPGPVSRPAGLYGRKSRHYRIPSESVRCAPVWRMIGPGRPGAPVSGMLGLDAKATPIADSGRAALAEGCFLGTAGLVLRRQTCPRVRARAGRRIAGAICGRDGAAARPVLVRAGHAVGDVDPLRRDAERGEGVTLWVRFLFITGDAGASEFEHRHRRGCRLASRHRDCSPNQSYGTRCPGRPRDWPLVKDGVGRGSPHETSASTSARPANSMRLV